MLRHTLAQLTRPRSLRIILGVERHFHRSLVSQAALYDSKDYSKLLYSRLSLQTEYQFLNPELEEESQESISNKLFSIIRSTEENNSQVQEVHSEILNHFQDWAKQAQLRVGFLMHLDHRIHNKEFITRVIKHMGLEDLNSLEAHELVTLLLLIYFRRDSSLEDMAELVDLDQLQTAFSNKIQQKQLTAEEICAGCLGLKRIKGFSINSTLLRSTFYHLFEVNNCDATFEDFFLMTLTTCLSRENQVYNDRYELVAKALESMRQSAERVSLMTAVKLMSFGHPVGCEDRKLSEIVLTRVTKESKCLNIKDILSISNFIAKSEDSWPDILEILNGSLTEIYNNTQSFSEIVDILNSLSYLSYSSVYNTAISPHIFRAMEAVTAEDLASRDLARIARSVAANLLASHPNNQDEKFVATFEECLQDGRNCSTLSRVPAFLAVSMRLDLPDSPVAQADLDTAGSILSLFHKKLPLELYSPRMKTNRLENRSKLLVNCYRGLVGLLGNERSAAPTRILPHFPEPDIVFGNIGGNCLAPPAYLADTSLLRPKRPPVGEWWVLVMATRKTLHRETGEPVGPERMKLRQLRSLGYYPVVVPYTTSLGTEVSTRTALARLLQFNAVSLPNVDDGLSGRNPRNF